MLTAFILHLVVERDANLRADWGRANYAQALARIRSVDAALSASIHDAVGVKPIACSGLLGVRFGRDAHVRRGDVLRVRVSATTQDLSQCLRRCLLENPPEVWNLDSHQLKVAKIVCDNRQERWSGVSSCTEIVKRYLSDSSRLDGAVTFTIETPLCFKSNDMTQPLPLPSLVFGSLLDRWNRVSPLVFDEGVRDFANQYISVSRFHLSSEAVVQKNAALRIGSVGRVTYRGLTNDRYWQGVMQSLADFAFFSGIGAQTSTGMGLVRRDE